MEFDTSYIKPSLYSLGLHILVIVLLLYQWEKRDLDFLKPQQRIVASVKVQKSDLAQIDQQIKDQKKSTPKPKPEAKPEPKPPVEDAISLEKQKEEQKKKEEELKKQKEEQKKKEELKKKEEQKKKEAAKKKKQQKDLLAEAMEEELTPKEPAPPSELPPNAVDDPTPGALDGDEDVARIASKVTSNWSRPTSYRKGMNALFVVDLMPTGEVIDVKLVEGSGDDGFDRSAEAAIRKSSPLPVPQDPKRFEMYFRKLNFLFDPEPL